MEDDRRMITFGPVPSRRLGRSLGINHIPPKTCTYSCAYCQLGRTRRMRAQRQPFYDTATVKSEVLKQITAARGSRESIDYLAFVPDGEPTLDTNLGRSIRALRTFGIPIAVITNSSLLHLPDVRDDLMQSDWICLKVDAVREAPWRKINRPHRRLALASILDGARQFASVFQGDLRTETMLVSGVNDSEEELQATAHFLEGLRPKTAYLAVPTRPPAESWARMPEVDAIAGAFAIFTGRLAHVELLVGYEGDVFASTGDIRTDLLSITSVHPMRESAVRRSLDAAGAGWDVVEGLLATGELVEVRHGSHNYYLRPVAAL